MKVMSNITNFGYGHVSQKTPSKPMQKNNVSFGAMNLEAYAKDLRLFINYGQKAKNRLPEFLKKDRTNILKESIEYIKSKDFRINAAQKNWIDQDEITWSMEYSKHENFLHERANILLTKTFLKLDEIYKNTDEVIIPFSGGRDSTSLLVSSLAFFPEKKYKLVVVLNGMTEKQENVLNQINYIKSLFKGSTKNNLKVETIFVDASENMKKYVIDTAKDDARIIGAPAICSGCKIVMEKEIWNYLLNKKDTPIKKVLNNIFPMFFKKRPPVLMGYTSNQRNQNWMEQTQIQIDTMQKEGNKLGINNISPLIDIIEEPYDSTLLLSSLGIPLKHHKLEMKCTAAGLNPRTLNSKAQAFFTDLKNTQTKALPFNKNSVFYYNPQGQIKTNTDLKKAVEELKSNPKYTKGAFNRP